jgi:hypothetical protein
METTVASKRWFLPTSSQDIKTRKTNNDVKFSVLFLVFVEIIIQKWVDRSHVEKQWNNSTHVVCSPQVEPSRWSNRGIQLDSVLVDIKIMREISGPVLHSWRVSNIYVYIYIYYISNKTWLHTAEVPQHKRTVTREFIQTTARQKR